MGGLCVHAHTMRRRIIVAGVVDLARAYLSRNSLMSSAAAFYSVGKLPRAYWVGNAAQIIVANFEEVSRAHCAEIALEFISGGDYQEGRRL